MKYLGKITDQKDLITKEYADAAIETALSDVVAPEYSQSQTYIEGDLVIYESLLYRAKQDISTPEAWTPAHWAQTTVDGDMATKTWVGQQGFLTQHQSLSAYRTASAQDVIDAGKQSVISDLSAIRSGASLGATAVQPSAIGDMATKTWVGQQGFLTQHQSLSAYYTSAQTDAAIAAAIGSAIAGSY